jgi:hypothetical protein
MARKDVPSDGSENRGRRRFNSTLWMALGCVILVLVLVFPSRGGGERRRDGLRP